LYFFTVSDDDNIEKQKTQKKQNIILNTVDQIKDLCIKRHNSRAALACKIQRAIGRPNTQKIMKIVPNNQLPNSPISRRDIFEAEAIFGLDKGSLKDKKNTKQKAFSYKLPSLYPYQNNTKILRWELSLCTSIPYLFHINFKENRNWICTGYT